MIAANKRFLKANLTQGVLGIQTNLINLYSNNLSAIATQAALIGGFSFTAVIMQADNSSITQMALSYFYFVPFTVCLVAALFVLSQATIVVMFGPTMALKGSTDEAVKFAAAQMMGQQFIILKAAMVSITALFIGACVLSWANYPIGIAAITTVVYIVAYYCMIKEGYKAYYTFVPNEDNEFVAPDGAVMQNTPQTNQAYRSVNSVDSKDDTGGVASGDGDGGSSGAGGNSNSGIAGNNPARQLENAQEATKTKLRAELWKRQSIEDGGLFIKYFAVLEKGRLDFYLKEKDYRENANPINKKPIKLWQYDLGTDHRRYAKNVSSLGGGIKSRIMGNEDFAMSDLLTSQHDLQYASRNYKFGLIPKVSSELQASTTYEFLAHDEKHYKLWMTAITTVVKAYDEIAALPSIEHTIRVGTSDVEMVVQAANNQV
uniref:PH domain-containing protein n=1 Tax=Spumella elongata TaxID=89044 RepID=A0A7S3H602_9STRA|mmetsp:Transcript_36048/g.62125  ORF Transcript_36048/g.62125 Transcript_36048/m.62125 type:complete len:431 (+) Transcript_36048:89-1381(+)|eukprot:CAMPEP_0185014014 /NCGR_PEP_ID=MMETSP1098-20130426/99097_1 /TAXON_ID=89044 /ORGANISM="Spumella elongata, Strain CCAP 955/1" /LENGTH=430 /DNA_ID=CAMNT_0027543093 /DNA_START=89 /DNA_END=1381 /DNA_ORIENTATION=+